MGDSWAYAGRNALFVDIPPLYKYAEALQGKTRTLDTVVGLSQSKWVDWPLRHGKSIADYYIGALLKLDHAFLIAPSGENDSARDIGDLLDDHPYPLLIYEPAFEPIVAGEVAAAIESDYAACETLVNEADLIARRYVHPAIDCDRDYAPIHYENGIKILDRFGEYDRESDVARVVAGWQVADETQLHAYNVSIQIINAAGQNVRQAGDRHLYDDILKWYVAEMSTAGLPPGDYRVVVIVYDRERSSDKLTGVDLKTGAVGPILPILHFTIEAPDAEPSG